MNKTIAYERKAYPINYVSEVRGSGPTKTVRISGAWQHKEDI